MCLDAPFSLNNSSFTLNNKDAANEGKPRFSTSNLHNSSIQGPFFWNKMSLWLPVRTLFGSDSDGV